MRDRVATLEKTLGGLTPEEREFARAVDAYRDRTGRDTLTWADVLRVLEGLGHVAGEA